MCLGVPAQVVDIHDTARAAVSISGVSRMISTDLMMGEELAVGDWVLIHVGFALGKIDEAEATETLKQIKQLGGGTFEDELESFTSSQIE